LLLEPAAPLPLKLPPPLVGLLLFFMGGTGGAGREGVSEPYEVEWPMPEEEVGRPPCGVLEL